MIAGKSDILKMDTYRDRALVSVRQPVPDRGCAVALSARVLKLPRTSAGREMLRQVVKDWGGRWDFPDEQRADDIDWDAKAVSIADDLLQLADLDRETEAYLAWRAQQ